jgi:Protein of unknown function (DUF2442)
MYTREIKQIIFENFELIEEEWNKIRGEHVAKHHNIGAIEFKNEKMIIWIDGAAHPFLLKDVSTKLAAATDAERETYTVSDSGYGIHWTLIDEDLSIDGLLGIHHAPAATETAIAQKE